MAAAVTTAASVAVLIFFKESALEINTRECILYKGDSDALETFFVLLICCLFLI